MVYYPALITGAFFLSLLILDLVRREARPFIGHAIFGLIAVILMVYLSQNEAEYVAWGIFAIPIILLGLGLLIGYFTPGPVAVPGPVPAASAALTTPCCPPPSPAVPLTMSKDSPVHDASGNSAHDASGNSVVTAPPAVTACGPSSGKTQCIDTRSLKSA